MVRNDNREMETTEGKEPEHIEKGREKIMTEITQLVQPEVFQFGLDLPYIKIKRTALPDGNVESVYQRMISERERIAKGYTAKGQSEYDKIKSGADREASILMSTAQREATITKGQGDAEATKIYAQAFSQGADLFELQRTLDGYKVAFKDGTKIVIDPNKGFSRFIGN